MKKDEKRRDRQEQMKVHSLEAQFSKPPAERGPQENTDMAHMHTDAC